MVSSLARPRSTVPHGSLCTPAGKRAFLPCFNTISVPNMIKRDAKYFQGNMMYRMSLEFISIASAFLLFYLQEPGNIA